MSEMIPAAPATDRRVGIGTRIVVSVNPGFLAALYAFLLLQCSVDLSAQCQAHSCEYQAVTEDFAPIFEAEAYVAGFSILV